MIERKPRILPFRWLEAIPCPKPSKDGRGNNRSEAVLAAIRAISSECGVDIAR